jgi:hypothetical protein
MVFQLWQDEHGETGNVERVSGRIRWGALSPSVLKKQLPDTSVIAKLGEDLWNVLRYCVFGEINPDIVVSLHDGMQDSAMLFYRETIDLMRLDAQERGVDQVIWALEYLNDYLDRHGVRLVLVLIPDKAQVYRQWLPEHLVATKDLPVSSLWSVADSLRAKDVPVINLLGPYRQVANQEELIYWRDDTHWNAKGIKMAADLTANEILRVDKGKNFE